jgi:eukaryotic-like serine/threonine-protein kinase
MPLEPGKKLGRYEIRSALGAGGMGEVYLAYDSELHRSVALKILPTEFANDQQRMQRFIQEARSASALNHPNILTIYEIGKSENLNFIATEFIDGDNLREHLRHTQLKLGDLLDIAGQIASALAKAHGSGIVHRDIKPENIMVTRDGYVKLLDFGLSKLTEKRATTDTEAPTQAFINTEPGKVMGTTRYMSPEQARGLEVDPRSDIWSLGVVLYEALTGHPPFEGPTTTDLIVAIVEREPGPISRFNSEVPQQLERIIRKTLAKDPEERYQVVKDLQIDLKNLKRELELEAEIDRTLPPEVRASALPTKGSTHSGVETIQRQPGATTPTKSDHPVSSAEYVVTEIRRHKTAVALGVVLLLVAAGGVFLLLARRAPALTDRDTILLADFTNTTGDEVFDGTLKQALAVQLGQSPYLSIAPDDRIRETLRFMGRSPTERLTKDIAREICQRQGVKAFLAGSIFNLGSNYVLTLEALNAQTGDSFAREQIEAHNKEEVLKSLGTIASKLREKLGESLASIHKFDAPIEQATTSSLEALKAFSLGDEQRASGKYQEAIPFYKHAVEIDPNFALAYARLAVMYFNLRQFEATVPCAEKAFALRDRVSEREKFYITARYYQDVYGDFDRTVETLDLWSRTYPRDYVPQNNLGVQYNLMGDFERVLERSGEAIRLNPNASAGYSNLGSAYSKLNRFDEATKVFEQAAARKMESSTMRLEMLTLAYVKGDHEGVQRQLDATMGKPIEPLALSWQSAVAFNEGRLIKARELCKRAIELALSRDQKELAARLHLQIALMESSIANCGAAKNEANAALALMKGREQLIGAAFALAVCGDAGTAESLSTDLPKRFPNDTIINAIFMPIIQASAEIDRNNAPRAIEILETCRRYESGLVAQFWPTYIRGLAYLRLSAGREAAAEFQKIVDHYSITLDQVLHPLSQLYLARSWAKVAELPKGTNAITDGADRDAALSASRKAYQDFLAGWKNADQDNPILIQAKAEYDKLK